MPTFIVNTNDQPTGEHEVHNLHGCIRLPEPGNRRALGEHVSCHSALTAAKKIYPNSDGCYYCCPDCHKK